MNSETNWKTWADKNKVFDRNEKKKTLERTQTIESMFMSTEKEGRRGEKIDLFSSTKNGFSNALQELFGQKNREIAS